MRNLGFTANYCSKLFLLLQLVVAASLASAQAPQMFTPTGDLNTGRNGQRAIPLNGGDILITGGSDVNENPLASSEVYHPSTGVFTTTGSLATARRNFAITLLDDGTVLVTGGYDNNFKSLASAEIYDPVTGTFTATGSLGTARGDHTATLLRDGTVLIAGGLDNAGNPLSGAELYDPSTRTFASTGSLNTARSLSTATALLDGTVLIEGGWAISGALCAAERYDPATQSFTPTGNLNVARAQNSATLLNGGAVLVAGGEDSGSTALASAELYDPVLRTFTMTGSLNTARGDHAATLLNNGTVLIEGGFACQPSTCAQSAVDMTSSAEIYDPVKATFAVTGSLGVARQVHTATLLSDGRVLVAGGWSDFNSGLTSAELYQPSTFTPENLISISIGPADTSLIIGASQPLVATGTFSDNSTQTLVSAVWSSSDNSVAAVTNDSGGNSGMTNDSTNSGVVFGVAAGSGNITACAGAICNSTTVTVTATSTATVSPSSITFPASVLGVTSAVQTVTVTNTGRQALNFSGIQATGDFAATSTNCTSVSINGTCTVQVAFTPTSSGSRTGALSLSDSGIDSPQTVVLSGSGLDFGFSMTNTTASVTPGGTATYQLSVNSLGGSISSPVILSCSGAPSFATCNVSPSSVIPGSGSSTVMVSVATAGPYVALTAPEKLKRPVMVWLPLSPSFGIFGLLLFGKGGRRKKHVYSIIVLLIVSVLLTGCGGQTRFQSSGSNVTPTGTYSLLVVGKLGAAQHAVTLTLNVQ